MRWGIWCSSALAAISLAACGGNDRRTDPAAVKVEPLPLVYCCNPFESFPQAAGVHVFSYTADEGEYEVTSYTSPPVRRTVTGDQPAEFPVWADSCGDFDASYELTWYIEYNDTQLSYELPVHDRCPTSDPEDLTGGHPALDQDEVVTGHTDAGVPWAAIETLEAWPPPDSLYSWFVSVLFFDAGGATIADCTHQRHDGTLSTFCDTGDVANLELRELATGPVFIIDGVGQATEFAVTTGTAPTPSSNIATDDVSGPMDDAIGDPPGEEYPLPEPTQ